MFRSATCSTARFSVTLIFAPENIRSIQVLSRASRGRASSNLKVWSVMRFLEKSRRMSLNRTENFSNRLESWANSSRMWVLAISFLWAARAFHVGVSVMLGMGGILWKATTKSRNPHKADACPEPCLLHSGYRNATPSS
jgi:hypothetical protein